MGFILELNRRDKLINILFQRRIKNHTVLLMLNNNSKKNNNEINKI